MELVQLCPEERATGYNYTIFSHRSCELVEGLAVTQAAGELLVTKFGRSENKNLTKIRKRTTIPTKYIVGQKRPQVISGCTTWQKMSVAWHRRETHPLLAIFEPCLGANKPFWAENDENVPKHAVAFTLDFTRSRVESDQKTIQKHFENIKQYTATTFKT